VAISGRPVTFSKWRVRPTTADSHPSAPPHHWGTPGCPATTPFRQRSCGRPCHGGTVAGRPPPSKLCRSRPPPSRRDRSSFRTPSGSCQDAPIAVAQRLARYRPSTRRCPRPGPPLRRDPPARGPRRRPCAGAAHLGRQPHLSLIAAAPLQFVPTTGRYIFGPNISSATDLRSTKDVLYSPVALLWATTVREIT